ncbi:MAG: cytidine deaminase [Acetatifactor sp.]
MMEQELKKLLVREALKARENAYAPYSGYTVGAALLTKSGKIYRGCNVENASYGATNCAERTAVFKAVSEGEREFAAIAITGSMKGKLPAEYAYPCGICRQVLGEFVSGEFLVLIAKSEEDFREYCFDRILPLVFGGESIS